MTPAPRPTPGAGSIGIDVDLDDIWLFPSSDFLSALEEEDRHALFDMAWRKSFKKGMCIFEAGDEASMLYIMETGRAKIYQTSPSGKDIILWFCFPGETFGLAELSRGVKRSISARAMGDSQVLCLPKSDFLRFIAERPSVALSAIDILSTRLRRLGQTFMNLATEDVPLRIVRLILGLAYGSAHGKCAEHEDDGTICVNITLTHQEIADMIGATRQTVTTALNDLKRAGIIRWVDHHIHIERPDALKHIIGAGA